MSNAEHFDFPCSDTFIGYGLLWEQGIDYPVSGDYGDDLLDRRPTRRKQHRKQIQRPVFHQHFHFPRRDTGRIKGTSGRDIRRK